MKELEERLERFLSRQPRLGLEVHIAPGAVLQGAVTVGDYSSVWPTAVLRGDINEIAVGHHSNIQDGAVIHVADLFSCVVGDYVTVGHRAILHACTVGNEVLVGMGTIVLDGSIIGDQCLIGAGALVTQGSRIPPGSLVLGAPAKVVRPLRAEERASLKAMAEKYVTVAHHHAVSRNK